MVADPVKLFISYSWKPEKHEKWVLDLATALRGDGVDVVLDKWDLKEGHDAHKFMEQMVADESIKKVAIICSQTYAEKANDRAGGVGTETQIITPEIYQKTDQNKFVAVVAERDDSGRPYLPIFYQSRIYIDLSDSDQYATNYEQLLRWIYDKPLNIKPELGHKPAFLEDTVGPVLGTTTYYKRALDFIRFDRPNWQNALKEYTEKFVTNLDNFRLELLNKENQSEIVVENIEQFLPYRNEAIELFQAIALYKGNNEEAQHIIHRFFEKLIPYMINNTDGPHTGWDLDNFKFIIHELFLYFLSILLKHECFSGAIYLINNFYYIGNNSQHNEAMTSYSIFWQHTESLEFLSRKNGRLSFRADLLEQRVQSTGLSVVDLMQADFTLYIRNSFERLNQNDRYSIMWWPETLLYLFQFRGRVFEIFARAQSKNYFEKICPILGINDKGALEKLKLAYQENKLRTPTWGYSRSFDPLSLMNADKIATRP